MPRFSVNWFVLVMLIFFVTVPAEVRPDEKSTFASKSAARRKVLVELFTSQGCDMCPDAERLLGILASQNSRIVPIALHVDYFNNPWLDPFSTKENSERQMAYHNLYKKPKHPEYGLYYTPMLMIDGEQSVNGRDRPSAEAAIRRALARKPGVALEAILGTENEEGSRSLDVRLASLTPQSRGRKLLVAAVVQEDPVETRVESGENAHKTLIGRFPSRSFQYQYLTLENTKEVRLSFPLRRESSWNADHLSVAVFVQDFLTGFVYQADSQPWIAAAGSSTDRDSRRAVPGPVPKSSQRGGPRSIPASN